MTGAPGGPKAEARGPRAVHRPWLGLAASVAMTATLLWILVSVAC